MTSLRISKKELRRRAEQEEAYYFTGNVYSYESVVHCLEALSWRTEKGLKTKNRSRRKEIKKELLKNVNSKYFNSLYDIVEKIETIKHDSYSIKQVYYSAGLYGNTGQLHTLKLYDKGNIVASYCFYY